MPCFHPREILVNKPKLVYQWIKQPDGSVKRSDKPFAVAQKYTIQVPCGKCAFCLALAQSQWSFRIEQEAVYSDKVCNLFVTFTYDNEHLPKDKCVSKEAVQRYLRNLRQNLRRKYFDGTDKESVPKLSYYFCAEYGSKRGRPHYHAILMFNKSVDWRIIQSSWNKGIVDIREFSSARAGYVAKYSVKQMELDYDGRTKPFHLQSKGLGSCFLTNKTFRSLQHNMYYSNLSGHKVKLPRYYLDKLGTTRVIGLIPHVGPFGRVGKSTTKHSYGYDKTVAAAGFRYMDSKFAKMNRMNLDEVSYDMWLTANNNHNEHLLSIRNLHNTYYEKSRLGY